MPLKDPSYSALPISQAGFASWRRVQGLPAPKASGEREDVLVSVGSTPGRVFVALKSSDAIPNWSAISNVATCRLTPFGFALLSPANGLTLVPGQPPLFTFAANPSISRVRIAFSGSPDFSDAAGSLGFLLPAGASSFKPTTSQWNAISGLSADSGTMYWRLSGDSDDFAAAFSSSRCLFIDCGDIVDLRVDPSHMKDYDEAVWPDRTDPPTFRWTYNGTGMKYFYVDVSTADTVPLADKRTITLGGAGVLTQSYATPSVQWRKIRKLAATGNGVLYWRVRAKDAARLLECASGVKTLLMDYGEWTLSDLDLTLPSPKVSWSCTADGIMSYFVAFSTDPAFPLNIGRTVVVPRGSTAAHSYILKKREVDALKKLARRNGVQPLYYRVRGDDADRAFVAYSAAKTVQAP